MFLAAIYPYIDFAISFGTAALFKCLDQGFSTYLCCKKDKTTKAKTIQAYINIYGGPQHVMSYKYSAIMNQVWVTMMYGVALPILFPIAALAFFNYYICERFLLTYYYQRPPIYDQRLNKVALETMKYSPVLMLFFGYWYMGNMQIFDAKIVPLTYSTTPITTEHTAAPSGDQALPLFLAGCVVLVILLFQSLFKKCCVKMGVLQEEEEIIQVDEEIGAYFSVIPVGERKRWYAQELHANKALGIETMGQGSLEQLRTAVGGWRMIKNAPNYEILSNQKYCQQFQFTSIDMCNTEEETAVSDTIMKFLYMGYAKKGFQDFNFTKALTNRVQAKKARQQKKIKLDQRLSKAIDSDGKVNMSALMAVAAAG